LPAPADNSQTGSPETSGAPPEGIVLSRTGESGPWAGSFLAMGSPCEVLIDTVTEQEGAPLVELARSEALRVERKFSRYRTDNIIHRINQAGGEPVEVDPETALLLDYAAVCHEISEGRFDITSGVLRRVWRFDGSDRVPEPSAVQAVLSLVGWHRVTWQKPVLRMPPGMEIDLGGIGKEYAVDRAASLLQARTDAPFLINFGGDLYTPAPRRDGPWVVGVDDPSRTGERLLYRIELSRGGLATSGDARRFVLRDGKRLGHILDPRTGRPVEGAPRSITVLAPTCLEAGTLSTIACLQGRRAREFLKEQRVRFRIA
jgi:FAD:protein FMN transferase